MSRRRQPNNDDSIPFAEGFCLVEGHVAVSRKLAKAHLYRSQATNQEGTDLDLPPFKHLSARRNLPKPLIVLFVFIVAFVFFVNLKSSNQLSALKEKRKMVEKHQLLSEQWWHSATFYHVLIRSFQDSNGDGIGDLRGLINRLDYLQDFGVQAILLSSIYKSPMEDFGRDISDFQAIEPAYGTIQEFTELVEKVHAAGMKLILEMVPNHCSDRHHWFLQSRSSNADNHFRNFFIWNSGRLLKNGTRVPPSNWLSRYGGSAWTWDEQRQQYYYHQFGVHQPDLNHRNNDVRMAILDVWEFWIQHGVDGLWIDDITSLLESVDCELDETPSVDLLDETEEQTTVYDKEDWRSLRHELTDNQPDMHEYLATWREHIEKFTKQDGSRLFLGLDTGAEQLRDVTHYYLTGADGPLCRVLEDVRPDCDARCIQNLLDQWMELLPDGKVTLWSLSSERTGRVASRRGPKYSGIMAMLQLLLPGSAVIYYGDELGLPNGAVPEHSADPLARFGASRDPQRTPMQWSGDQNAGFTSAPKPWLPIQSNFLDRNVKRMAAAPSSILLRYKKLLQLRQLPSFRSGQFQLSVVDENFFSFLRFSHDESPYFVVLNVGNRRALDDFSLILGLERGLVVLAADDDPKSRLESEHLKAAGSDILLQHMALSPGQGYVIRLS